MTTPLHITSGDSAGNLLKASGLPGEVWVWHDILYDGPRKAGWPDEEMLHARAVFLQEATGGGMRKEDILQTLKGQYKKLEHLPVSRHVILWFDAEVDQAFSVQDFDAFARWASESEAPLPRVPAAAFRWLQERPDPATGLGRLEQLALDAVESGCETPGDIFTAVAAADTPPQYWGDTTLWAKINGLADRVPPQVKIEGPADRLPQWESGFPMKAFRITAIP